MFARSMLLFKGFPRPVSLLIADCRTVNKNTFLKFPPPLYTNRYFVKYEISWFCKSFSDQTKLWFRFWFYRNPKVWVSTETVFQPKPKPKLKFFGILALFPKYSRWFETFFANDNPKLLIIWRTLLCISFWGAIIKYT